MNQGHSCVGWGEVRWWKAGGPCLWVSTASNVGDQEPSQHCCCLPLAHAPGRATGSRVCWENFIKSLKEVKSWENARQSSCFLLLSWTVCPCTLTPQLNGCLSWAEAGAMFERGGAVDPAALPPAIPLVLVEPSLSVA